MSKRTPLFEEHQKLGGRIVEFGGWEMPVQYSGIIDEHITTRTQIGLFDVSHMGEIEITGPDATPFMQKIVTQNVEKSKAGEQVQYSLMCYEDGGVVDDILIYKHTPESFLLCVNAGNIEKDYEWICKNKTTENVEIKNTSKDYVQIAVQGPKAERLLQTLTDVDLSAIKYYRYTQGVLLKKKMIISRTGYTGEPGFELYVPSSTGPEIWQKLLAAGQSFGIKPCGLGARDTLRVEMRYPLYGHEISEKITPLEADLSWVVKLKKDNFIGKSALVSQKEQGLKRKLVGFKVDGTGIPRQGYPLQSTQNELIGEVTSGTLSPTLKKGIGIGFVKPDFAVEGTQIHVMVRSKPVLATIVPTPFVHQKEKK